MGRLQRKKAATNKRKTEAVDRVAQQVKKDAGGKKAGSVAGFPREIKKKQTVAINKQKNNYLDKALHFLREVKIELKKVVWPSRKQTIGSTLVVIVLVFIISLFLGMADWGLSSLISLFIKPGSS
jgi:preprotein translocase subunit SecE